jgi:hypothetical protein
MREIESRGYKIRKQQFFEKYLHDKNTFPVAMKTHNYVPNNIHEKISSILIG